MSSDNIAAHFVKIQSQSPRRNAKTHNKNLLLKKACLPGSCLPNTKSELFPNTDDLNLGRDFNDKDSLT